MPNDFIDSLYKLQQQNFLGGLVQGAAANKISSQSQAVTETVGQLNKQLQEIEGGTPLTPPEQLQRLKKDPTTQKNLQDIESMTKHFVDFQQKVQERKKKYQDAYNEAIGKIAIAGGQEAERVSQILSRQKQETIRGLEQQAELPQKEVKYLNNIQKIRSNNLEFQKQYRKLMQNRDMQFLTDIITDTNAWNLMPKGKMSFESIDDYNKTIESFNDLEEKIKQEVINDPRYGKRFGDKPPTDSAFNLAIQGLEKHYGISFDYRQTLRQQGSNPYQEMQLERIFEAEQAIPAIQAWLKRKTDQYNADVVEMDDGKLVSAGVKYFLHNVIRNEKALKDLAGDDDVTTSDYIDQGSDMPIMSKVRGLYVKWALTERYTGFTKQEEATDAFDKWVGTYGSGGEYWAKLSNLQANMSISPKYQGLLNKIGELRKIDAKLEIPSKDEMSYEIMQLLSDQMDKKEAEKAAEKALKNYDQIMGNLDDRFGGIPVMPDILYGENPNALVRGRGITWNPKHIKLANRYLGFSKTGEGLTVNVQRLIEEELIKIPEATFKDPSEAVTDDLFNLNSVYPVSSYKSYLVH